MKRQLEPRSRTCSVQRATRHDPKLWNSTARFRHEVGHRATVSRTILGLAACLVFVFSPATSQAQIVNVLPHVAAEGDAGLSGKVSASLTWKDGNSELTQLDGGFVLAYRRPQDVLYAIGNASYGAKSAHLLGVSDDDIFSRHMFEHIRYRRRLTDILAVEVFAQHEADAFRRLRLRLLGGLGPRLELAPLEQLEINLGTAYFLSYELFSEDSAEATPDPDLHHRWSSYLQASYKLDDALSFFVTLFAQPRFDKLSDIRVLGDSGLVVKANEWFSVRMSLSFTYDSDPPPGVEAELDTSAKSAVVVSF